MTDQTDASIYFACPPYAHQVEAHLRARDREAFAFLAEMGTGKSGMLTSVLAYQHARGVIEGALILAPKSVCRVWVDEQLPRLLPTMTMAPRVLLWSAAQTQRQLAANAAFMAPGSPLQLKVLVMNIEALITDRGWKLAEAYARSHRCHVAIDESTRIKNPGAKRTKRALKLGRLAVRRSILTGMPMTQSPLDLFSQYEFLGPDLLGCSNFFSFKARYAVLKKRYINGRSFDEVTGYQRLDELQRLALAHGYRRLKAECLDLPAKVYAPDREVALSEEQARAYEAMRDTAVAALSAAEVVTAPMVITQLLRLRQILAGVLPLDGDLPARLFTPNPRVEALLELLEEVEGKAIIWSCFVPVIRLIAGELQHKFGPNSADMFYGRTTAAQRQEIINAFQDEGDPLRFFVGQVNTGGIGINLTQARTVIYADHDWSLEARAQSEDRAHRIGQGRSVTYINLVAPGTIDEDIIAAVRGKRGLADAVTGDGWRNLLLKKGDRA